MGPRTDTVHYIVSPQKTAQPFELRRCNVTGLRPAQPLFAIAATELFSWVSLRI